MYDFLDKRYARALYEIAKTKNKVEEFLSDLYEICEVLDKNKKLLKLLKHPEISINRKKEIFSNLFKGKIDDELLTFLYIVIEKGRILYLREKLNQLEEIYLEELNTIKGTVKTKIPLTTKQYDDLVEKLERKYNKTVLLETKIDEGIIGGIYININNQIIDGTINKQYEDLRNKLLKENK
ncbi:F0F1 ATP synthase subunit delta [Clostridium thermobutyricum]|uniref:ATP synthase subunit delta n=1 Tax=Clostridium thermobutyricum DSM 4928 TaxID=1121339 RepID=A0A1V4SVM3_9CLOT|nr:F0F1 ATP synthase subunit delta [Clostridium thermobutyricum]OPX47507.1 ATP synthase subunit delta, sodium ion specific [Clostridium thermobutyricum DSM 4928]